ncbi:lipopolysaccharide assembly protein LapA domain-containing protein [Pseudomonas sp. B21-054]|uniref:lipopolysaccharide assembly protein LapA domain-containing protein n=1 Tax=Pseudomonas sp. B21-054 TaxID=2895494 RepID=UPI002230CAB1|nr:lipopolysaccharide assembly protein LapA domain-containing protein [Pseudomonas sp. B21-054]UZE19648.1 lipopolysaccharide assembly protein LapA domain-containing protein [Pseudomonas sp. B21-054]
MRNLKRIPLAIFVLLMILVVLAFVLENQQQVSLSFLGWAGPQLPVSAIAVIALLIGMLLGPLLGWLLGRIKRASRKRLA